MGDKAQASGRKSREEPLVFGVDFETDKARFRHRRFVELITASAALGIAVSGCAPPTPSASPTPTPSPSPTEPANLGTIPPGVTGAELQVDGVTQWIQCGAAIPANSVCTCNCVTGTQVCSCVGVCSCAGDTGGGSHYWYPN